MSEPQPEANETAAYIAFRNRVTTRTESDKLLHALDLIETVERQLARAEASRREAVKNHSIREADKYERKCEQHEARLAEIYEAIDRDFPADVQIRVLERRDQLRRQRRYF